MEAKSIPEVAFEWLCECGAFDQLKKQCECYTADFAVCVFSFHDLTENVYLVDETHFISLHRPIMFDS